jgi:cobalt-zinc-cadmium efflux system outer membrane protein
MNTPLRAALMLSACLSSTALAQRQPLTLEEALRRTLSASPQTASAAARIEALAAARTAAGLPPQPTIEVTAENFSPPKRELYDQFQLTGSYSQRIERGGKREARVAVADRDLALAGAMAVTQRLDIIAAVQKIYVEVQAAETSIETARQKLAVATELEREVLRRVRSARDPIFAGTRAKTWVAEATIDLELAIHARDAALKRLISFWNGPADVTVSASNFLNFTTPAGPTRISEADLAVAESRAKRAEAAIDLQRANAERDPTISAGPRYLRTGDLGFVAGFSIPIGGRRLAQAHVAQAQADQRKVAADVAFERFNREREIALSAELAEESRHEAEAIRDQVIPKAEQTLKEVRGGYSRGFFSFADVSAAQNAVTTARARMIDAARRFHDAKVDLDRQTGRFTTIAQEAR